MNPEDCQILDLFKYSCPEINFCLAITKMENTTAIWAETSPGKKDFSPMEIDYGEYFNFNGNKCTHGNKINEKTREKY